MRLLLWFLFLAVVLLSPPQLDPPGLRLEGIDEAGRPFVVGRGFAELHEPDRSALHANVLLHDLAYAAAAAGPVGTGLLVAAVALLTMLLALWTHGGRCALRRGLVTLSLGAPLGLGLLYTSCFLEGRTIRLGPDAGDYLAASLHTQTIYSTGLLTPKELVRWHYHRGFRVLNVSDRDDIEGARAATAFARKERYEPDLRVIVGEEWHGRPDLVLVHVQRAWKPGAVTEKDMLDGVRREGGTAFVAHPWSKLPRPLADLFVDGAAGAEIVNGVIHGGAHVAETARRADKALLGVLDYKYGPHVTALTLLPQDAWKSPRRVVDAIENRRTRVLYAVPGGAMTGALYDAKTIGTSGFVAGLRSLFATPPSRRVIWLLELWALFALWRLMMRLRPEKRLPARPARILLAVHCALQFGVLAGLSWQVRAAFGPIRVEWILAAAAVFAVPLLAASTSLALHDEERMSEAAR